MKEARIIFPMEGALTAVVQQCIHNITHAFGGCTIYDGMGHWKHPNGSYEQEICRIADIAYEPNEENDAKLYDLAWDFRQAGNQVEVYLRYGNGHVQMVTEKSCMDNGHGHFDLSFGAVIDAMNELTDPGRTMDERMAAFEYLESALVSRDKAA